MDFHFTEKPDRADLVFNDTRFALTAPAGASFAADLDFGPLAHIDSDNKRTHITLRRNGRVIGMPFALGGAVFHDGSVYQIAGFEYDDAGLKVVLKRLGDVLRVSPRDLLAHPDELTINLQMNRLRALVANGTGTEAGIVKISMRDGRPPMFTAARGTATEHIADFAWASSRAARWTWDDGKSMSLDALARATDIIPIRASGFTVTADKLTVEYADYAS